MRGTDVGAGEVHLHRIGCAAGQYDKPCGAGGELVEVTDVTIIYAR